MKRRYAIKITQNIIRALLLVILTSMVAFALMKASPVDPLQANVGQAALGSMSQEQIEKLREYWGVGTSPVPVSYTHLDVYKRQILCGLFLLQYLRS